MYAFHVPIERSCLSVSDAQSTCPVLPRIPRSLQDADLTLREHPSPLLVPWPALHPPRCPPPLGTRVPSRRTACKYTGTYELPGLYQGVSTSNVVPRCVLFLICVSGDHSRVSSPPCPAPFTLPLASTEPGHRGTQGSCNCLFRWFLPHQTESSHQGPASTSEPQHLIHFLVLRGHSVNIS